VDNLERGPTSACFGSRNTSAARSPRTLRVRAFTASVARVATVARSSANCGNHILRNGSAGKA
jgi:hypothetical protein